LFETAPARGATSQIEVTVINCAQDAAAAPTLRIVETPNTARSLGHGRIEVLLAHRTAERGASMPKQTWYPQ
jgi:hypothetical protein